MQLFCGGNEIMGFSKVFAWDPSLCTFADAVQEKVERAGGGLLLLLASSVFVLYVFTPVFSPGVHVFSADWVGDFQTHATVL